MTEQKIGVISIAPFAKPIPVTPFDLIYKAMGSNTGNFMFTVAMYRQLAGEVNQIGFNFDPVEVNQNYDAVVIPCANWLRAEIDWTRICDLIEKLEIPVVPIGLGLQSSHSDLARVSISASSVRLLRLFSQKSNFISVRGDFTRDYLSRIGFDNVVTTGCPSIYMRLSEEQKYNPSGGIAIHSTRYPITRAFLETKSLNRDLFQIAAQNDCDIIFQSEREELEYLLYNKRDALFPKRLPTGLQQLYGFESPGQLVRFLDSNGHAFIDLGKWAAYAQTKSGILGTRLHGTILALNSGCPAVLFAHDSRTAEMIAFAKLPTVDISANIEGIDGAMLRALIKDEDYERYVEQRQLNSLTYRNFLRESALQYKEHALF